MSLEGYQVPITTNLRYALNNLRQESEDRIFWVDALCINQSKPAERGRQVSQMRYVYELASTVVVFAGGTIEGYDVAMDYIETIGGGSKLHYDPQIEPHANCHGLNAGSQVLCDHLTQMLSSPWFCRTWTIQEFALAKHLNIRVWCTCSGRKATACLQG
jgi:hypothetical protein